MKKIALGLIVLVAVFLVTVDMQPDNFLVIRSAAINAPANKIFPYLNSPRKMAEWSPWTKLDPNGTFTYEGPATGIGATSKWSGNSKLGVGSATIVGVRKNELVRSELNFEKPMKATNIAEFRLQKNGHKTEVTWSMFGKNNFTGKAMNLVFNCERMVGKSFEQGLLNLKKLTEPKE